MIITITSDQLHLQGFILTPLAFGGGVKTLAASCKDVYLFFVFTGYKSSPEWRQDISWRTWLISKWWTKSKSKLSKVEKKEKTYQDCCVVIRGERICRDLTWRRCLSIPIWSTAHSQQATGRIHLLTFFYF